MTVQHVPASGFNVPPAGAPNVPSNAPGQAPQGFSVPPAGEPPRLPGNGGQPHQYVNQQPGFVQQQPQQVQQSQPQPGAPMDAATLAAILQQALGQPTPPATPAQQVSTERPSWMPASANTFNAESLEDPVLRSMATIMQSTGKDLDLDRVLGKAMATGDTSLIDFAYIHEKGGTSAQQVAEIAKGLVQMVAAKSEAITQGIYQSVGGEANWAAATAAFNTAAPQELRVTVAQMLNSTNQKHIEAGAKIVAEFGRSSGKLPQAGVPLLQGASFGPAGGNGMNRADFQAELRKLNPDAHGYIEAREALFARRSLGKASGL